MRTQAESTYIAHNMFGQIKMEIQGVTRMAYSPKLWLMAIGW
jgi:hypothetical protein